MRMHQSIYAPPAVRDGTETTVEISQPIDNKYYYSEMPIPVNKLKKGQSVCGFTCTAESLSTDFSTGNVDKSHLLRNPMRLERLEQIEHEGPRLARVFDRAGRELHRERYGRFEVELDRRIDFERRAA